MSERVEEARISLLRKASVLLKRMLEYEEDNRPTMQEICSYISTSQDSISLSQRFAGVFEDKAFLYNTESQQLTRATLSVDFSVGGSYVELSRDKLLCIGGQPASSGVYELDLLSFQLSALPPISVAPVGNHIYIRWKGWTSLS